MSVTDLNVPPHSIEAEQSVLGALMIDVGGIDRIGDLIVSGSEFYQQDHRLIFATILRMAESGKTVDVITVAESLESSAELTSIGGLAYLGALAQNTPSAANIRRYAEIVYEKSVARDLLVAGMVVMDAARAGNSVEQKIELAQAAVMSVGERSAKNDPVRVGDVLSSVIEKIDEMYQSDSAISGLPTGFGDLDEKTAGLQPGDLVIIAGRPSMGKTAFAMNIAEHVAINQKKVAVVFSLEMPKEQLVNRALASVGKINMHHVRTGKLQNEDWSKLSYAVGKLKECALIIDDTPAIGLMRMRTAIRKVIRQYRGVDLVVVDYIGLMTGKGENRNQEIGSISRGLKAIAKDLRVPIIALAQLNRGVENEKDRRPMMKHLRDSGEIEQDADIVVMIHREEYYNDDAPEWGGLAELIVRKNRNGPLGEILLDYRPETISFASTDKPNPRRANSSQKTYRRGLE